VPVAVAVDGVLVEGFIDLLVETRDGFVVVDYKTDPAPSDSELDAALARYTPQGAAYALALEEALGRPVARCLFVFARSGGAVEREITDLHMAVARVRAHLRTLTTA
jgi:ATP-dependent helicase/nuclease subunit A